MRRLFLSGSLVLAGLVFLPVAVSPWVSHHNPAPDYRSDPRLSSLRHFFKKFNCPAWKYSAVFLEAADLYNLDWRLLPSITFIESTGGKAARYNNLFGWKGGLAQFSSPTAGIRIVGYHLANSALYKDKDLDELLATYNPNAEYAEKVKSIMRRISPSE